MKKIYEKPEMEQIKLQMDESILVKTSFGGEVVEDQPGSSYEDD